MKKKVLILTLVCLLCLSSAFAGAYYQTIGVYFGSVNKVFIDGADKTESFKEPFIYNGTTYVSLRDVAEALGEQVSWDDKTQSIYIGSKPITLEIIKTSFSDIKFNYLYNMYLYRYDNRAEPPYNLDNDAKFNYSSDYRMKIMEDSAGVVSTSYENGLSLKAYNSASAIYYNLNKKYDLIKGKVGYDYILNNGEYGDYVIRFDVDGEVRKEVKLSQDNNWSEFEVLVTSGEKLRIDFVNPNDNDFEPFLNLVNIEFEQHFYK